ncbi:MAG: cupin domain-containing protein [Ktedonobacterales bacterium]
MEQSPPAQTPPMASVTLEELAAIHAQAGKLYHEFLRVPTMSAGLYRLAAGASDPQLPHSEDELYYIISGQASIQVGETDTPVAAGSLVFVAAHVEHRFHDISEELSVLVFFAPAEYSQRVDG